MAGGIFDLEKQFAFYGAYHNNAINVLIHTIFVWPIFFTALVLGCFTPALGLLPFSPGAFPFQEYMILNLSFVVAVVYALFYIMLDKKAGTLAAALCLLCWVSSNSLAQR
nr:unknown [Picea sitchensis]